MDQEELVQLPQDLMKGLLENLCPSPKSVAEGENADRNTIIRELAIDFLHRVLEKTLIIMNHFYSLEIHKMDVDLALEHFAKEELEIMPHYMTDEEDEEEEEYDDEEEEEDNDDDDQLDDYPIKIEKVYGLYDPKFEPEYQKWLENECEEDHSDDDSFAEEEDEGPIISRDFGIEPTRLFDGLYRPVHQSTLDHDFAHVARQIANQDFRIDPFFQDDAFTRLNSAMKAYLVYKLKSRI